ncbi:MAG: class I SAM-dependent methyltransferase [Firmicutes bacterium]|nr:class I SAM-dependent methyltransferase [Bacillota bacterium]
MLVANNWKDYELIDAGNGERLERWGKYILRRPDPQAIWPITGNQKQWEKVHAHYHRSRSGGGHWEYFSSIPERWTVKYKDLSFYIQPTGFKHTGLFPEQAVNWDWIIDKIKNGLKSRYKTIKVLNLFAYTGGATVAAAYAGAEVCHVDAAKGMVNRAKENLALSGLGERVVRFITDDVIKFTQRENRRGHFYDAIIMDPPSYGRGPGGEMWKIEDNLYDLIMLCMGVLSDNPLFFLINTYTTGLSPVVLRNILTITVRNKFGGIISEDEIGLPISSSCLVLPCGAFGRWEAGV